MTAIGAGEITEKYSEMEASDVKHDYCGSEHGA